MSWTRRPHFERAPVERSDFRHPGRRAAGPVQPAGGRTANTVRMGSRPLPAGRRIQPPEGRLGGMAVRSEEHTSELQSPCNLVCRLLLEKKNETVNDLSIGISNGRSIALKIVLHLPASMPGARHIVTVGHSTILTQPIAYELTGRSHARG